jgi:putative phosphoesterase
VRIAALYDIHGNLPALEAVLAEIAREDVNAVVVGGDVAAGPMPSQTIERLVSSSLPTHFVCGNADREVVDAFDEGRTDPAVEAAAPGRAAAFAAARLQAEQRDVLAAFEVRVSLEVQGLGQVMFCHGSPRSDIEIVTAVTQDSRLETILEGVQEPLVVLGHTHRQFDRRVGRWRVVNAGSVGSPYEGRPGAFWALVGPEVELRRTEYDIQQAAAKLRETAYPDVDEMIRESLTEPVDAEEVSRFFEQLATREAP